MKKLYTIFLLLLFFSKSPVYAQTQCFKENLKWGIKEKEQIIIPALYDTIFNYDSTDRVCLACFKIKKAAASKFIKTVSTSYSCNYLDKKAKRLVIRGEYGDTNGVFYMGKSTVNNYLQNKDIFTVTAKGKKNLVNKDFKQLTFKGYTEIEVSPDKNFYLTQIINDADVLVNGLVNTMEREIVPYEYSNIKVNCSDSLIVACSAGIHVNSEDVVYDFDGKKKEASKRHIDLATKHYLIHKIFEPKEYYIFYNRDNTKETTLEADEIKIFAHDEILVRIKKDWYLYDLNTNQKKPYKTS